MRAAATTDGVADGRRRLRASERVRLAADLRSAAGARHLLRDVLIGTGDESWLEAAELACTELISNAVLHAHTEIELTVEVDASSLRVGVRDFSPALPLIRSYDTSATTGRGLALVAALTTDHGIDVEADGKTVWFTLTGATAQQAEQDLLDAWADADWELDDLDTDPDPEPATRTVTLLGLPPTLWLAAREHHDALIRELVLYLAEHDDVEVDVSAADRARGSISTAVWAAVQAAEHEGVAESAMPAGHPSPLPWTPASLDLVLHVPAELGPAYSALQDTLDAAERLSVADQLLVRPGLPEVVAVRDWACEQVVAQLAGVAPSPWPGTAQERFTTEAHARASEPFVDWDVGFVRDAARGLVAADDANRIIAISRPLAELLGWEVADIVGRRVVAIIPPRLREGHVAGFSRHLSSGEAHLLGLPLDLPVLRVDGTEVLCRFLIEKAPPHRGRTVYLAWIDPLPAAD